MMVSGMFLYLISVYNNTFFKKVRIFFILGSDCLLDKTLRAVYWQFFDHF